MRIAVVGAGVSGLVCALRLQEDHDVTLFDANDYLGGHTNTIDVELNGVHYAVDTGFIVFNDRTYPNFIRLLDELGVSSSPTGMSFSVRCDRSNLEYNGSSLNGLFSQRRNLMRPTFYRMLRDIVRFNREAVPYLERPGVDTMSIAEFIAAEQYGAEFADRYLLPMGAAIWSCPVGTFAQFPLRFVIEFYAHHGLLSLKDRPQWYVIDGGSRTYVEAIRNRLTGVVRLNCRVTNARRTESAVQLRDASGETYEFDEVVFACHADQALEILDDPTEMERDILSAFPYSRNDAVLHTDHRVLPRRRRAWAAWNYHIPRGKSDAVTLSYNMNLLQHIESRHTFCVTLNESSMIDESTVLRRIAYQHPIFSAGRQSAQWRHDELIRSNRTSFCGAYWGYGFHEDGVRSGLRVCEAFAGLPLTALAD